jgi:L-ascorbate metabolism protein UlaG (beta-lactamase superfamily)
MRRLLLMFLAVSTIGLIEAHAQSGDAQHRDAGITPVPITVDDPSDPRMRLQAGQVAIEYVAHSCFRIHTAKGTRLLIDPFASRLWLGYNFPTKLAADAVLITHPHYDHDADVLIGHQRPPWAPDVRAIREPTKSRMSRSAGFAGSTLTRGGRSSVRRTPSGCSRSTVCESRTWATTAR